MDRTEKIVESFLNGKTYQAIADDIGVTRERIRQILEKNIGSAVRDVQKLRRQEREEAKATAKEEKRQRVIHNRLPETRFWKKVKKTDGCWYWMGAITAGGFGHFRKDDSCPSQIAHRFAYEVTHGAIPPKSYISHTCKTSFCVNPNHLIVCTPKEVHRFSHPKRKRKEVCKNGHNYSKTEVYYSGVRICRECVNARNRKGYVKQLPATTCPKGHPRNKANTYIAPSGQKQCRVCNREKNRLFHRVRIADALAKRSKMC